MLLTELDTLFRSLTLVQNSQLLVVVDLAGLMVILAIFGTGTCCALSLALAKFQPSGEIGRVPVLFFNSKWCLQHRSPSTHARDAEASTRATAMRTA
jgi:hypothetical protein